MRKIVPLIAALALSLSLSACGSSPAPNGNPGASADSGNKTTESKDTVELNMITLTEWDDRGLNDVIAAFEKQNPNIKVKLEAYPFRQLFETIEVKMGAKAKEYDILTVDGPLVTNYTVKGYLAPLDGTISQNEQQAKWIDSSIKAGTYNGKLMAAPMNTSSQVLYYNKDLLAKQGITPPAFDKNQRWTWEQLVDAAKKLTQDTNGDGQPDIYGLSFEQVGRAYQNLALAESLGAKSLSDNGIVATGYINSDKSVQAAKFFYDTFNTWKISPKLKPEETQDYFKNGKVAFFVGGTWNSRTFTEAKVNYGIAPHPYFQGGKVVTPTGSWHVGVSNFSTKKDAAAKFVKFLTMGEGSTIWFNGNHDIPSNLDILKQIDSDKKYDAFPDNIYKLAAYEVKNTAVPRPSSPGFLEWETLYSKAYDDIKNGTDPKKALDDIAAEMDRQLKKYQSVAK